MYWLTLFQVKWSGRLFSINFSSKSKRTLWHFGWKTNIFHEAWCRYVEDISRGKIKFTNKFYSHLPLILSQIYCTCQHSCIINHLKELLPNKVTYILFCLPAYCFLYQICFAKSMLSCKVVVVVSFAGSWFEPEDRNGSFQNHHYL